MHDTSPPPLLLLLLLLTAGGKLQNVIATCFSSQIRAFGASCRGGIHQCTSPSVELLGSTRSVDSQIQSEQNKCLVFQTNSTGAVNVPKI
ncbi:unnamed protein product [Ceratitis capitata]|uniref:(Mediterranean fruit fly) hypothetical protein n=1 Tax=Ceratitis capitata TaxID=7213 RepID=A0A811VBJ3_CERCA|nr:unnamed protein product [Ceratitis capitata]